MADESNDFDPSELSEGVAEEAQHEEQEVDDEYPPDEESEEEEKPEPKPKKDEIPKGKPEPKKPPEKKPERKPLKVKVNGKEQEIPADQAEHIEAAARALGVEVETLLRGPQMLKAGQERLRQAAEAEKKAKAITDAMSKDARAALKASGLTDQKIAELGISIVEDLMKQEQMSPEQRRIQELEGKLKADEDAKREAEEKQKAEEAQAYQTKVAEKVSGQITQALETGKIPKDPYTVKRLASLMQDHLGKGGDADELDIADFLPLLNESMQQEHTAYLGKLSGEDIIRIFPDTAEKVRKAYAARAQNRIKTPARQPTPTEEPAPKHERRFHSTGEVLRAFVQGK